MPNPIYLPIRDRLLLRHAASLLDARAKVLHEERTREYDGVFIDRDDAMLHQDLKAAAAGLRTIARTRKGP